MLAPGTAAVMACQLVATVPLSCVDANAIAMAPIGAIADAGLSMPFYDARFLLPVLSLCTAAQVVKLHNIHRHDDTAPIEPPVRQGIRIGSDQYRREQLANLNTMERLRVDVRSLLGRVGLEEMDVASRSNRAGVSMNALPLSRFDRLFDELDTDGSGTLDFDEFVEMVRRLNFKPKGLLGGTPEDTVKDDVLCALCYDLGCDDDELDELSCLGD